MGTTNTIPTPTGPGTLTDDIWWKAQPPKVQKLRSLTPQQRVTIDPKTGVSPVSVLLLQGYILNGPVLVWGYSPKWQMDILTICVPEEKWFPGLGFPQLAGLASIIPEGDKPSYGISVSNDAKDYPPFV